MDVENHFSSRASKYDHRRSDVVPGFDSFYSTFTDLLEPGLTLDLGAGTGILSKRLGDAGHEPVLLDLSREMLRQARDKGLRAAVGADMRSIPLPPRPTFENATSALAIHHLSADEKQELYRDVHDVLRPGGTFLHGDMVRAADEETQGRYMDFWLRYMEGRGLGDRASECVEDAETYDVYETLENQLDWLRDAGFEDVECHWKRYNFAVFGGHKP